MRTNSDHSHKDALGCVHHIEIPSTVHQRLHTYYELRVLRHGDCAAKTRSAGVTTTKRSLSEFIRLRDAMVQAAAAGRSRRSCVRCAALDAFFAARSSVQPRRSLQLNPIKGVRCATLKFFLNELLALVATTPTDDDACCLACQTCLALLTDFVARTDLFQ